jgi:hypothetical protein
MASAWKPLRECFAAILPRAYKGLRVFPYREKAVSLIPVSPWDRAYRSTLLTQCGFFAKKATGHMNPQSLIEKMLFDANCS